MALTPSDFPIDSVMAEWVKVADVITYFKAEAEDIQSILTKLDGTGEDDVAVVAAFPP